MWAISWNVVLSGSAATGFTAIACQRYWYLRPQLRVPDEWKAIADPMSYESYTCLETGARFEEAKHGLDRLGSGKTTTCPRIDEKRGSAFSSPRCGFRCRDRCFTQLYCVEPLPAEVDHVGRKNWHCFLFRSDEPISPWRWARKILSHQAYNFYNVVQHPFFDQEGGRIIYFEGTYTSSFSDAKQDTPRYNYNQITYRLRLDDPRLEALKVHP